MMSEKLDAQCQAMQAMFDLAKAVDEHGLTINDLIEIIDRAVASGHQKMELVLSMARTAMQKAGARVSR